MLTQYSSSDKIEKNDMGGYCSAYGEEDGRVQGLWGNLREEDHSRDPDVDGRKILRWIFRKWDVGYGLDRAGSE